MANHGDKGYNKVPAIQTATRYLHWYQSEAKLLAFFRQCGVETIDDWMLFKSPLSVTEEEPIFAQIDLPGQKETVMVTLKYQIVAVYYVGEKRYVEAISKDEATGDPRYSDIG